MINKNKTGNADNKYSAKKSSYLDEYEAEFDEECFEELTEAERRMLSHGSVIHNEYSPESINKDDEFYDRFDKTIIEQPEEMAESVSSHSDFEKELDKFLAKDIEEFMLQSTSSADSEKSETESEGVLSAGAVNSESSIMFMRQTSGNKSKFDYASAENSEQVAPFVARSSFFETSIDDSKISASAVEGTESISSELNLYGTVSGEDFDSSESVFSESNGITEDSTLEGIVADSDNVSENVNENADNVSEGVTADLDNVPESVTSSDTIESTELTPEELAARKRRRITYNILMVASLAVFIYCVGRIGIYFYEHFKYKEDMKELQDMVGSIAQDPPPAVTDVVADIYFPDERVYASTSVNYNNEVSETWSDIYSNLVELNSDVVGWIQIDDTEIKYPVMYTPKDYDYYLRKDLEGNYLTRGLPFLAEGTQLNISQNYLIYGHNMRDGTAFHDLTKYLDNKWVEEHPYAYFNTAYSEGMYQVMAVVISKVYNIDDECFKYYKYSGNLSEDEFNTYVYYMTKMSSVDTGIDAVYGDQLLSLSTCYKIYDPDGRLVVLFKRIK